MTTLITFNMNDYIWVHLSAKGRKIYFQYYGIEELPNCQRGKLGYPVWNLPNTNGYITFQFHEFLRIFGPHIGIGFFGGDFLESMEVQFNIKEEGVKCITHTKRNGLKNKETLPEE